MADFDYGRYMEENGGSVGVAVHIGGHTLQARELNSVTGGVAVSGMAENLKVFFTSREHVQRVALGLLEIAADGNEECTVELTDVSPVHEDESAGYEFRGAVESYGTYKF